MSEISLSFDFKLSSTQEIITKRGLEDGGRVQQFIDSEVLRLSDPYIPFDTGMLKDSGILSTDIGSGMVVYNTPYAKKQYYEGRANRKRGRMWFERMKVDHKDSILAGAARISGGEAE